MFVQAEIAKSTELSDIQFLSYTRDPTSEKCNAIRLLSNLHQIKKRGFRLGQYQKCQNAVRNGASRHQSGYHRQCYVCRCCNKLGDGFGTTELGELESGSWGGKRVKGKLYMDGGIAECIPPGLPTPVN